MTDKTTEEQSETTALDDDMDAEDRFNEAHQGIMGMLFAAYKLRDRKLRAAKGSLPLTIIGGFLGSGKTTLLNHLLMSPHGRRLVVLVNDFGSINIDAALVASQSEDMIQLTNGCACCAVSADLTNALIDIAVREDLPDAIVLEASGVADPNGVVQVALSNPAIRLDGSLVVVDAETLQDLAENPLTGRLVHNQISAADLILLSKVDLVSEEQRAAAHQWLTIHYPDKHVIEAVNGNVRSDIVLGINTTRDLEAAVGKSTDHAHAFESLSFTSDVPLDGERLQVFFDTLPTSLIRAKGILHLADMPAHRTIFQRVGQRCRYTTAEPWGKERAHSSLVLIGPTGEFDHSTLTEKFEACKVDAKDN